jgi:ribose 5-phosphate isomerase B
MRIAIGSDHRGIGFKSQVINLLQETGTEYHDFGAYDNEPVDYPDIAADVAKAITSGAYERGILICGTGIGMSIAANKIKGVRAALAHDEFTASRARQHNDANILCLSAERPDGFATAIGAFLQTPFEGGRHQRRVEKIKELESGNS